MKQDQAVRTGLVGVGAFGAMYLAQARKAPGVKIIAVCDLDVKRAVVAAVESGYASHEVAICSGREEALRTIEAGKLAIVPEASLLVQLPLDVVLEATGSPEAGAATALAAIENGMHSVLATKEAEVVAGPILAAKARKAGLMHVTTDGDQPNILIQLVARARSMGLKVVAAGKSTASDFVWDPEKKTITAWKSSYAAPHYRSAFANASDVVERMMRDREVQGLGRSTAPDLCEMTIVANCTDLSPDKPELHAPIARTTELPSFFRPREAGGLLERTGVIDMFNCLRSSDELSFAGGVFVTVETPNKRTGLMLSSLGMPGTSDGRYMLIHNPMHLLGIEAILSVRSRSVDFESSPRYDMVGSAKRDIKVGEVLELGERHTIKVLEHLMMPSQPISPAARIPYYLAEGRTVKEPVAAGTVITYGHLDMTQDSTLARLRMQQDKLFFPAQ